MSAFTRDGKLHEPYAIGGNVVETVTKWSGPTSYDTGGSAVSAKDLGLTYILFVVAIPIAGALNAYPIFASADPVDSILIKLTDNAGTEVTSTTDKHTSKFIIRAIGVL